MSPALAGGFFAAEPPGSPVLLFGPGLLWAGDRVRVWLKTRQRSERADAALTGEVNAKHLPGRKTAKVSHTDRFVHW